MLTSNADKPPVLRPPPVTASVVPVSQVSDAAAAEAAASVVRTTSADGTLLHWLFLFLALAVIFASLTFNVRNQRQVIVPILNMPLPGTCTFREITSVPCPGCGLTRSFISLGHGRLLDAWNYNPAGLLFFAVVAFQIPYRILQIVRIQRGLRPHRFAYFDSWILVVLVAVLLIQWVGGLLVRGI